MRPHILSFVLFFVALAGAGCAETQGYTVLPTLPPTTRLTWVKEPGRYTIEPVTSALTLLTDGEGKIVMTCPEGYREIYIPNTPKGIDAKECIKARTGGNTKAFEEIMDPAQGEFCRTPNVITNNGGMLGCAATCPAGEVADSHRMCGPPPTQLF